MIKDSNEKINIEIDEGRQLNKINLEKNNIYNNINISNISTKETTEISSETEESYNGNKPQKKNLNYLQHTNLLVSFMTILINQFQKIIDVLLE